MHDYKKAWEKRRANGNGTAWNKGKKGLQKHTEEHKQNLRENMLGNQFAKGNVGWNKGGKAPWTTGEKHHSWKGGVMKEIEKGRNLARYKEWRDAVYERDNRTCQDCGVFCQKGNIVAHHLLSYIQRADLRFDVENGQVLCRPCHARVHADERNLARSVRASKLLNKVTVA